MYEIYETEAYVLKNFNQSENDKKILIFSRDFGLIWLSSSGSRKINSKFRSLIQDFSFSKFFLVRGKRDYKMTGGELIENIFFDLEKERDRKILKLKNFFNLIEKFLIKNHPEPEIYDLLEEFISDLKKIEIDKFKKKEIFYIVKLLNFFGYFDLNFLSSNKIDINDFSQITKKDEEKIIFKINTELKKVAF